MQSSVSSATHSEPKQTLMLSVVPHIPSIFKGFDHPVVWTVVKGVTSKLLLSFVNLLNIAYIDRETPELLKKISIQHGNTPPMQELYHILAILVEKNPGRSEKFNGLEGNLARFNGHTFSDLKRGELMDLYVDTYCEYLSTIIDSLADHDILIGMCELHPILATKLQEKYGDNFMFQPDTQKNPINGIGLFNPSRSPTENHTISYETRGREATKAAFIVTTEYGKIGVAHFPADFRGNTRHFPSGHWRFMTDNSLEYMMCDTNCFTDIGMPANITSICNEVGFGHTEVNCHRNNGECTCPDNLGAKCNAEHELVGIFRYKKD